MKRLLSVAALLILALPVQATPPLPAAYVGLWATPDSVFEGEDLLGGTAIYLDTDGQGAMVAAPLPVTRCGTAVCTPSVGIRLQASVDTDGHTLRLLLLAGKDSQELVFSYSPDTRVLVLTTGKAKGLRMEHRTSALTNVIKSALHGQAAPVANSSPPQIPGKP